MTIRKALAWSFSVLKKQSDSTALDSEILMSHVLLKPREYLLANPDKFLSQILYSKFQILIQKRSRRWPVAYLTGHKEFFGLDFIVTRDVLVPRPETELLIERALQILKPSPLLPLPKNRVARPPKPRQRREVRGWSVIDLGTGSGNIIISILKNLLLFERNLEHSISDFSTSSKFKFLAIDSSKEALKTAGANARHHGVLNKIKFLPGNLLFPILHSKFYIQHSTLILANLPYLTPSEYRNNPDLRHEPRSALIGGHDGLKYFKEFFFQIRQIPHSKFHILLEHSPTQKSALAKLVRYFLPKSNVKFHKDLSSRWRVMEIQIRDR